MSRNTRRLTNTPAATTAPEGANQVLAEAATAAGSRSENELSPSGVQPTTWWFPTSLSDVVMECYWNPTDHAYNKGCHPIYINSAPPHIVTAIRKSSGIG